MELKTLFKSACEEQHTLPTRNVHLPQFRLGVVVELDHPALKFQLLTVKFQITSELFSGWYFTPKTSKLGIIKYLQYIYLSTHNIKIYSI